MGNLKRRGGGRPPKGKTMTIGIKRIISISDQDARAMAFKAEWDKMKERMKKEYKIQCTGITAVWCPVCGDCTCKDRCNLNDNDCPLHGVSSEHAALEVEDGNRR